MDYERLLGTSVTANYIKPNNFVNFGSPILSLELVKLNDSNFVVGLNLINDKTPQRGSGRVT